MLNKNFQRNEGRHKGICLTNYSLLHLAIFSNRGAKVHKTQVNCDLTISKTEGNKQHTLQLQRLQGFYIILNFHHIFQLYVSCIHFESAFNMYRFRERKFSCRNIFNIVPTKKLWEWGMSSNMQPMKGVYQRLFYSSWDISTTFHGRVMDKFSFH